MFDDSKPIFWPNLGNKRWASVSHSPVTGWQWTVWESWGGRESGIVAREHVATYDEARAAIAQYDTLGVVMNDDPSPAKNLVTRCELCGGDGDGEYISEEDALPCPRCGGSGIELKAGTPHAYA